MISSDLEKLYEAVVKDPDADAPRLAYAVACEAHGDADRAEFIRLQIEAAALKRAGRHDDALRGFQRISILEHRSGKHWAGPIRQSVKSVGFFRGFVEWVDMDASNFLEHAEELFAMAPIRRLKLTGLIPVLEAVCSSPHLARLVSLNLEYQQIGDDGVKMIARSPHVQKLVYLGLLETGVTEAGVEALAASENLRSLRVVAGLPKQFREDSWSDQGQTMNVLPPPAAPSIEQKYGRKAWLHELEESAWRDISADEY